VEQMKVCLEHTHRKKRHKSTCWTSDPHSSPAITEDSRANDGTDDDKLQ
jgi:hypothetical protein